MLKKIRIILATPRPVQRLRLAKALDTHPSMTVIAQAADLSEAYTLVEKLEPDVVLLAVEYTRVPEFECMKAQFDALKAQWLAIEGQDETAPAPGRSETSTPTIAAEMAPSEILGHMQRAMGPRRPARATLPEGARRPALRMAPDRTVLIGASTGGIDALMTVLSGYPADCPPTAIVQHTGRGFSDSLVRLLGRKCAARVVAAEQGTPLLRGTICVAAGTHAHVALQSTPTLRCLLAPGPPVSGHLPSIDALFRWALPMAPSVVAVLLTGMGRDRAEGLLALRRAGAHTLGQGAATSVVYGMPRIAHEIEAVMSQLPLDKIGPEIVRLCHREADTRPRSR